VDVWLDETLLLDNFKFRTASPFIDAPAGVEFTIAIQGPDSQSPDDPIWAQSYTLADGETYILVADGIISTSGYDPATPFDIAVFPEGREIANINEMTDMLVHHGSTDTPVIDIYETSVGLGLLVDNLSYSEYSDYVELPAKDYILEVRDGSGMIILGTYLAPFQGLIWRGAAVTVLASGFMVPENNSNGPAFGLWAARASGGNLIELPVYNPIARVQVIHNSADAAASVVDVWLNETLLLDNFAFRTASPFIDAPADTEFTIAIKGPDSQDPDDPIWSHNYTLVENQTYILVAEGIVSPSGYEPATPFDMAVFPQAREMANNTAKTDMLVHHGSTDAPTVDIYETGVGVGLLIDDLSYAEFSAYLELEPLDYIIEVRDETGTVKVAAYSAPLQTLGLESFAITVVASGFLSPENNSNGPAFGLWVATAAGGNLLELPAYEPKARVQVIHNSADAAAAIVDVWLNETLLIDNFAFRTASPFVDAPAGEEFTISINSPDSQSPADPIWSQNYTLTEGETYILVAEGIVSPSGYEPSIPFGIAVFPFGREEASSSGQTDLLMHHGSTDTPVIDIVEVGIGLGLLVNDLSYSEFAGYFSLATVNYIMQIRDGNGLNKIAAYEVPLASLGLHGEAVSIIASGFLNPANNSNGPDFGLFVALDSGGPLLKLPVYAPMARIQVIHNSADTAVAVVDVWLNQTLLLDDFEFRSASPFIDAPAKEQFTIAIKGPGSQDPYNPLWAQNFTLTEGQTYILVADGILSPEGYDPQVPFGVAQYPTAREEANISGRTDILVHHGATDAPTVDVVEIEIGAGILVDDMTYGQFRGYLELPTLNYILEIRDETGSILFGTFRAPLQTLGLQDAAITVVASGFLNPAANSEGAPIGLWAALASGGPLVELEAYVPLARVQVIHNSADETAAVVDVWLDQTLLLDDFAFRTATPFVNAPANSQFTIAIKGPDSQDPSNPLWSKSYTLTEDETYILVANGIISPEGYDPVKPFDLFVYEGAVEAAASGSNTDVLVFHGATDAPTVDIVEILSGAGTIFNDLSYGQFDGYLGLPTANYSLDIRDESGSTVVANFSAPLADLNLQGKSLTVLASGFLDPATNSDGPDFGLLAVLANGTALMLTNTTGMDDLTFDVAGFIVYPNPANGGYVNVSFEMKAKERVAIEMMDISGRIVKSTDLGMKDAGVYEERINIEELASGMYLLNIRTGNGIVGKKLFVR
jgi:hypothetical protein